MLVTVEAVSTSKKGFLYQGKWYNRAKMMAGDFSELKKGEKINITENAGFVSAWTRPGDSEQAEDTRPESPSTPAPTDAAKAVFGKINDPISRGCAANAVLGSRYVGEYLKGGSDEESIQNIKDFIENVSKFVYGGTW